MRGAARPCDVRTTRGAPAGNAPPHPPLNKVSPKRSHTRHRIVTGRAETVHARHKGAHKDTTHRAQPSSASRVRTSGTCNSFEFHSRPGQAAGVNPSLAPSTDLLSTASGDKPVENGVSPSRGPPNASLFAGLHADWALSRICHDRHVTKPSRRMQCPNGVRQSALLNHSLTAGTNAQGQTLRKVRLIRCPPAKGCSPSLSASTPWKRRRDGPPHTTTSP